MATIVRRVVSCCLAVLWVGGGGARAHAPGPEVLVVGRADPALDVPAVQAAVGGGGRVALSGTFDFGPTGRVVITRDVQVRGRNGATVRGGFFSFFSALPPQPVTAPGPSISITHLTFEGSLHAPIHIGYASGVEIGHNTVRDVRPRFVPAFGFSAHQGMIVGTYGQFPSAVVPGAITGRIRIHHNEIDMAGPAPASTLCMGVFVNRAWGATISITDNTISNCARNAIEALDHHRDENGVGEVEISHNRLSSQSVGVPWPNDYRPNGIVAGWFFDPSGVIDSARNPRYLVSHNRIDLVTPKGTGIFAATNGAVIEENRISVSGANSFGIYLGASDALLEENTLSGSGAAAIDIAPFYPAFPAVVADRNTVACNDAGGFQASRAGLLLGGNDNTVYGFDGTVLDTGVGNQVIAGHRCDE